MLAQRTVAHLRDKFMQFLDFDGVFWKHESCGATASFQEQIQRASAADVVDFVLWSRLGSRLPAHITHPVIDAGMFCVWTA